MAALPTPDTRPNGVVQPLRDRLRLIRELGASAIPTLGALEQRPDGSSRLVVVERAPRRRFEEAEIAAWIRDARRLVELDHPNVVRVRDAIVRADEVRVVSDFIDGVRWTDLAARTTHTASESAPGPPLETALRVFVDALAGLSALHNLRDSKRQPLKLVHGGLTPDCLIVGIDGVARVVGASRLRSASARLPGSGSAYLAPEVLLEDDTADARADVYSIGVMLWEALSGRAFLPHLQPSAIVTQLLSGRVPAVTTPSETPWAAPLAEVATRALSADPEKRFASASTMAAELRRIAGARLPTAARVASLIHERFGDSIRARRQGLERGEVRSDAAPLSLPVPGNPPEEEFDIDVDEDTAEASSTAPTLPPPGTQSEASAIPDPLPIAPRESESATAITPIAIVTPLARAEPAHSRPSARRPKAWLFLAIVGSSALALAATGWFVTRTHESSPPLLRPADPVSVAAPPPVSRPIEASEPSEPAEPSSPPAESAAPASPGPRAADVPNATRAPSRPAFIAPSAPGRPRPTTTRRPYDPQGI